MIGDPYRMRPGGGRRLLIVLFLAILLAGCGPGWSPERSNAQPSERLTQEGRYRVQSGDSLPVIAFNFGLDWRDIAEWNGIAAPYTIFPDQELRLSPPQRAGRGVVVQPAQSPGRSVSRDLAAESPPGADPAPAVAAEPERAPEPAPSPGVTDTVQAPPTEPAGPAASVPEPTAKAGADPTRWLWPTEGRLLSRFRANDPSRNGIEIGGAEGQPVVAAAPGEVVYSGNGLIGYGELIIIKHSDRILSAYAHNRQRLVAEGQSVGAGERIGEMGRDDRNQPLLHFEIRVNGAPQDPLRYLPGR